MTIDRSRVGLRKRRIALVSAVLAAASSFAGVQPIQEGGKYPELKTRNGKEYSEVTVAKMFPDSIRIIHSTGATTIPVEMLPEELLEGSSMLSGEQLLDYRREQQEIAKLAQQQKRQRHADLAAEKARKEEELRNTPKTITADDVKRHWITVSWRSVPKSEFHADHAKLLKKHREFVDVVKAGYFNDLATLQALEYNIAEYQRVKDLDRAAAAQSQLGDHIDMMDRKEQAAQAQQQAAALQSISRQIEGLRQELRSAEWRLRNW